MEIKLEIGTRGARKEFERTYTRAFLKDKGLTRLESSVPFAWSTPCAVRTKFGWMCSFSKYDVLTYMGSGIWDLKVYNLEKGKGA